MRYRPYSELDDRPCIIVDGAPHPSASITLSHWPRSGTPTELMDDLSTQIVFHYLDRPELHVEAEFASNDHFDEDGLASLFAVLHPEAAQKRRERICDFAAAGDFGTYTSRTAARAAFAVSSYADPERSPLGQAFFHRPFAARVAGLYAELLEHVPQLLDHAERYEALWREEEEVLEQSERALREGTVRIEEIPSLDLAVVTLPLDAEPARVHRYTQLRRLECHPMAIYNATKCFRILYVKGRNYQLEYRYESWVQYASARPLPRVDLAPLAAVLTQEEAPPARWVFEGVAELNPRLRLEGASESRIAPGRFLAMLEQFLVAAPAAWDPYAEGSSP